MAPAWRKVEPHPFLVANALHRGSYVSLQSALAFHGVIPEHVPTVTSVGPGRPETVRNVLGAGAPLRDEVEFLLRQELVETRIYFGILAAMAAGREKLGEIINATHLPPGNVSKYLAVLQSLGLVVRDVPASEHDPDKSKRGRCRLR